MAIQTTAEKNSLATKYAADALFGAVYTTTPGATAGTEPAGGSPAYARKSLSWSIASGGVVTATATFDIPGGVTLVGAGLHTAATGGTYLDGVAVGSQAFASQGTYQITFTYSQS
jgi:hypothetical protein